MKEVTAAKWMGLTARLCWWTEQRESCCYSINGRSRWRRLIILKYCSSNVNFGHRWLTLFSKGIRGFRFTLNSENISRRNASANISLRDAPQMGSEYVMPSAFFNLKEIESDFDLNFQIIMIEVQVHSSLLKVSSLIRCSQTPNCSIKWLVVNAFIDQPFGRRDQWQCLTVIFPCYDCQSKCLSLPWRTFWPTKTQLMKP